MLQSDSKIFTYYGKLIYLSIYHIIVLSNTIFAKNISLQPWTTYATPRQVGRPGPQIIYMDNRIIYNLGAQIGTDHLVHRLILLV
jgi:hypothetical protein